MEEQKATRPKQRPLGALWIFSFIFIARNRSRWGAREEKLRRRAGNLWPIFVLALLIFTSWKIYHAAWASACLCNSTFVDFTFEFTSSQLFPPVAASINANDTDSSILIRKEACGWRNAVTNATLLWFCDFERLKRCGTSLNWPESLLILRVRPSSRHIVAANSCQINSQCELPQPVIKLSVLLLCPFLYGFKPQRAAPATFRFESERRFGKFRTFRTCQQAVMWSRSFFPSFTHDTSCGAAQSRKL